jgi:glutamate synthase domain-containing protein 3
MKQYREQYPKIVIGGYARSFLGEYMAGGIILILGLDATEAIVQDYVGTGIHGGTIYIAGELKTTNSAWPPSARTLQKMICSGDRAS